MRSFSIDEVAEIVSGGREVRVHSETVKSWIRNGELKALNISESEYSKRPRYVVTEDALAAFIERRSTVKSSPASAKPAASKLADRLVAGRDYVEHYKE